jgi:S1-C subfamily serine protease
VSEVVTVTDDARAGHEPRVQGTPTAEWWAPPLVAALPASAPPGGNHHHRGRRALLGWMAALLATGIAVGAAGTAVGRWGRTHSSAAAPITQSPVSPNGQGQPGPNDGYGWSNPYAPGGGSTATPTGTATTAEQVGVVDLDTVLDFGTGKAAGTGIVLSSTGEILTNNHVVQGSTSISVTVVSTGKSYTATVVGTDPAEDVAVIQLKDASGLATARLGDSSKVAVGNAVTAVGNAGGTGGVPSAATGTVTAIGQSITASDPTGSNAEQLTDLIQINAPIQAGDSGGPLYASDNSVIGIDTAASSPRSTSITGFAIPIAKAVLIAQQIEAGPASSSIHLGYPAFLGVEMGYRGQTQGGAAIAGVVSGSAAQAGLTAGDTITSVDGSAISSASDLSTVLAGHRPGQQVRLSWSDASGQTHSATITLGAGPAD